MADPDTPKVKWLAPIAEIRPTELVPAIVSLLWIFLAISAYYIIKPIRGLILQTMIGVDNKPWAILSTVAFTGLFSFAYGRVVAGVPRQKLIVWTYGIFVACVIGFAALVRLRSPLVGYVFYVWVSTFNVMVVSQFWALSADVWSKEEGKRLFPFIGLGTVSGGVAGSYLVTIAKQLETWQMLVVSAGMLLVCLALAVYLLRTTAGRVPASPPGPAAAPAPGADEKKPNALAMVLGSPFLRSIAVMTLLLNLVNSNNEWILDKLVNAEGLSEAKVRSFYGSFYLIQNIATVLIQAFVTRRIQKAYGARVALFFLPLVGILGGTAFLIVPSLFVIRWEKIFENATDYSIQSNTRELLYLPTTTLEKYAAKNVNDTFVVRIGDALAAGSIAVAVSALIPTFGNELGLKSLIVIDLLLGIVWLGVANRLGKLHRERMEGLGQAS